MYISNLLTVVIGDSSGHVGVCRLLQHANNQEYGPKVIEQLGRATGGCHWQIPALTIYIFKADPLLPDLGVRWLLAYTITDIIAD